MTVRHNEPVPLTERPLPLTPRSAGSVAALKSLTALARELYGVAEAGLSGADGARPEVLGPGTPFCAVTLRQDEPLVVLDSAADVRFALSASPDRFYAGVPLTLPDGLPVGTFYLSDPAPRTAFSPRERLLLHKFAAAVADVLLLTERRAPGPNPLESVTEAFFTLGGDGRVTYLNARAGELLGCDRREILGHDPLNRDLLDRDALGRDAWDDPVGAAQWAFFEELRRAATPGRPGTVEHFAPALGGWLEARVYPAAEGFSVFVRDVNARKEAERRAAAQASFRRDLLAFVQATLEDGLDESFYQRLLDVAVATIPGAQTGSLIVRKGETFYFVAAVGFDLAGLRTCTFKIGDLQFDTNSPTPQLVYRWCDEELGAARQEVLTTHGLTATIKVSLCVPMSVEGEVAVVLYLDNLTDEGAFDADAVEMAHLLAQQAASLVKRLELETALRAEREAFERAAYHDGLTGLPNRYLFEERLERATALARRSRALLAVLFFDLDNFKDVNDTYGHGFGDALINAVAARAARTLRTGDLLARWGGDEFVILLPEVSSPFEVERIAERLLAALKQPFAIADQEIRTAASLGIALCEGGAVAAEELVKNADVALYRAKATRGGFYFYTEALRESLRRRLELGEELRAALAAGGLAVSFQPRVRLGDGRVTSVEALARWQHPQLGVVSPSVFIPLAEELGLIRQLGGQILGEACAQARRWHDAGTPCRVAVNVSVEQLKHPGFVGEVRAALKHSALAPELLELEITESSAMDEVQENVKRLLTLRRMGVKLAVDDFGTAYSSLAYLRQLPLHALKIDQSFVRNLTGDRDDNSLAIVRMVVMLGHSLGLHVVAEGVETEAQRALLAGLGCDEAQGFLFAEPLSAADFGKMLALEAQRAL